MGGWVTEDLVKDDGLLKQMEEKMEEGETMTIENLRNVAARTEKCSSSLMGMWGHVSFLKKINGTS